MSLSSGSTPSPSSSDERRDQQLQQNLATLDGSLFIASDDASPNNTRPQPSPSLASSNAQNINECGLLQSQTIDHAALISNNNEHHANRNSGEDGRISSQQTQQTTPLPMSYADDDDSVTSGSSDRQSLIRLSQALEYDRLQQQHTQRQLQVEDVLPVARSGTANDRIAQQPEPTTTLNDDDDGNDIGNMRAKLLSTNTRSPEDSLASGYDRQIREYNRLQQSHMQKKQQSRPHDQTGDVNTDKNISSNNDTISDLAIHPNGTQTVESRPNKTDNDLGEGSPFIDLDVLEAQLRERVHVSSQLTLIGDNLSSNNNDSPSQPVTVSTVPITDENLTSIALEAQLHEYERLNRAHIQQQQQSPSSRLKGLGSIEGGRKVAYENDTAVGASGTTDLRNSSGVGDRFAFSYVATLNQTERNTSSVICSTCNKVLYIAPFVGLFYCPRCRNITSSMDD